MANCVKHSQKTKSQDKQQDKVLLTKLRHAGFVIFSVFLCSVFKHLKVTMHRISIEDNKYLLSRSHKASIRPFTATEFQTVAAWRRSDFPLWLFLVS